METKDPIQEIERIIKEMHDSAGVYTKPVLQRYPLIFAFLITFSFAAILHGFELATDEIEFLHKYPLLLICVGILGLIITGTLYKKLEKGDE